MSAPLVLLFDRTKGIVSTQAMHIKLQDPPGGAIEGPAAGTASYASQMAAAAALAADAAFGDGESGKKTRMVLHTRTHARRERTCVHPLMRIPDGTRHPLMRIPDGTHTH